jgi:hypothetical protein
VGEIQEEHSEQPRTNDRTYQWFIFVVFFAISAVSIRVLISGNLNENDFFKDYSGWVAIGGAVVGPPLTIVGLLSIIKNWNVTQVDEATDKLWNGTVKAVVALVGIGFICWIFFSVVGSLSTAPPWAVIIIVLLILILFKGR